MDTFQEQFSQSYTNLIDKLSSWINELVLAIPNIVISIVVLVIAYFLSSYIRKISRNLIRRFTKNKTMVNLVSNLSSAVFILLTIFLILGIFNLGGTINKILATAGVLGLAVGLALQDPLNNLFSGVFMSVKDLYNIGDLVETNGYFGQILSIDLRTTKLRTLEGQEVIIPNKSVVSSPLKNYTITGVRRVDVTCGVSYGDDLKKVKTLVLETLRSFNNLKENQEIDFMFTEYGSSSINFVARFWIQCTSQRDYLIQKSEAIMSIKEAFDSNNIMIPYPIRTLDFGIKGGISMQEQLSVVKNSNGHQASSLS